MLIEWQPPRPKHLDPQLVRAVVRQMPRAMKSTRGAKGVLVKWQQVGRAQQLTALEPLK